ncbi:hypothetical protein K438DRAFT_2020576 [Mycena galopus ATCC 62051]|nr:hypothetical protein K438DRAFT_2020576 [Mycena galopus ATCC 62051]
MENSRAAKRSLTEGEATGVSTGVAEARSRAAGSGLRRSPRTPGDGVGVTRRSAGAAGRIPRRSPRTPGGAAGVTGHNAGAARTSGEPTSKRQRADIRASSPAEDTTPAIPHTYDDIDKREGPIGVLRALSETYGSEFVDVNQAFMAARKSFSRAKYEEVMAYFKMDVDLEEPLKNWKELDVPEVCLPESVLQDISMHIYRSYATHGSPSDLNNDAAAAAFLPGPFQCLTCLFGGILKDRPEQHIPGTTLSGGGRVDVEIFGRDTACTLLQLKHREHADFLQKIAQACCELFATWQLNRRNNKDATVKEPAPLIPVYTILCDDDMTYFLAYDGKDFRRRILSGVPLVSSVEEHVWASVQVAQHIFAVLMEEYNNVLRLYSEHRGHIGDTTTAAPFECASSMGWADASKLGWQSAQYFRRAHDIKSEVAAQKGLDLLYQSVSAWPRDPSRFQLFLPEAVQVSIDSIMAKHRATRVDDPNPDWTPPEEVEDPLGFPLERPAQDAVERFWSKLSLPGLRTKWDAVRTERRSPFQVLSHFAANIEQDTMRNAVKRMMDDDDLDTLLMIEALIFSQEEGHWVL